VADDKLAFARAIGAEASFNAAECTDVGAAIRDITHGGAAASIDALGSPQTCFNSIAGLAKRGKHIQVGLLVAGESRPPTPMDQVLSKELSILGSHGMQAHRYPAMLEMIRLGQLQPEKLLGQTISLDESVSVLPRLNQSRSPGITVISFGN